MYDQPRLEDVAVWWQQEERSMSRPLTQPEPPKREVQLQPLVPDGVFDPQAWTCSVCGKVRVRELLHSKAIQGRQQLVCAPSCLGAERRTNGR